MAHWPPSPTASKPTRWPCWRTFCVVESGQPQMSQSLDDAADDRGLPAARRAGQEEVLQQSVHGPILRCLATNFAAPVTADWQAICASRSEVG